MGQLFQELWARFPICVKVKNESGMSACRASQLVAPRVDPRERRPHEEAAGSRLGGSQ